MKDPYQPVEIPPPTPEQEIAEGKPLALLSYVPAVGLLVSLVAVAVRNNGFALFHAKQALVIHIIWIPIYVLERAPVGLHQFLVWLHYSWMAFALVLIVFGVINVLGDAYKKLPLIGQLGDEWFSGIQKN